MLKSRKTRADHIALVLPSLAGGGAERSILLLANAFIESGRKVDLLLFRHQGAFSTHTPPAANIIELSPSTSGYGRLLAAWSDIGGIPSLLKPVLIPIKNDSSVRHIAALRRYFNTTPPDIALSAITYTNLVTLWSSRLAETNTPVVVSERIALSTHIKNQKHYQSWRWRHLLPAITCSYKKAAGIVAVSKSVADDLASSTHLPRQSIKTLYNPIVDQKLQSLASQDPEHPWFQEQSTPVIIGVGRLTSQKDFKTLIRAFAQLRKRRNARLMILGEGELRPELARLGEQLNITEDFQMPGFVENPYQYLANASVFAITSLYEGLPGSLIQALACGCPSVSTNCPGGSAEILADGRYGKLVPIGDVAAVAEALALQLDNPPDTNFLKQRGCEFSVDHAANQYLSYLDEIVSKNSPPL